MISMANGYFLWYLLRGCTEEATSDILHYPLREEWEKDNLNPENWTTMESQSLIRSGVTTSGTTKSGIQTTGWQYLLAEGQHNYDNLIDYVNQRAIQNSSMRKSFIKKVWISHRTNELMRVYRGKLTTNDLFRPINDEFRIRSIWICPPESVGTGNDEVEIEWIKYFGSSTRA